MLSYRHAFHAGNHADILKHYTLSVILDYFNYKDKPYCVVDTHAGAGMYALDAAYSQKNKEFETGITQLLSAAALPDSLSSFVELVQSYNTDKTIRFYPGSPKVTAYHLREYDQLHLFELHPSEYKILSENFNFKGRKVKIKMLDGFKGLKSVLPPSTKRGLVIIDPPYETKEDYHQVISAIKAGLRRFATGTYIVWYPLLPKPEPGQMIKELHLLQPSNWLDVRLNITKASIGGYGMYGSGLFIINPPWTLPKILEETIPYLNKLLAKDENASYQIAYQIN